MALLEPILRLEKGAMYSATARKILAKYHDVEIGAYSYGPCFKPGYFPPQTRIGRYTSIAAGVRIVNENHQLDTLTTHPFGYKAGNRRHPLNIGHDVWIGYNAIILPGCHEICTGAIVGAGSIVTKDVPPYAIVAGNPARAIRSRFEVGVVDRLMASRWWEREPKDINFNESPIAYSSLVLGLN